MAFAGNTRVLPYVTTYDKAHKMFNSIKRPRSSKWLDHQRPLKDTRSTHYRIEQGQDAAYYDVCLFATTMARFHKPDPVTGLERRQYIGPTSQTSKSFMWNVLLVSGLGRMTNTEGVAKVVPITQVCLPNSEFSADLWFNAKGLFVEEMSTHAPVYRKVSDERDKQARALTKKLWDPLVTMATMRLPEYEANCAADYSIAGKFYSVHIPYGMQEALRNIKAQLIIDATPDPKALDAFFKLGQKVFDKIVSDRADALGLLAYYSSKKFEYSKIEPVDAETFQRALWRRLHSVLNETRKNGREQYPLFVEPKDMVFSNVVL